MSLKIQKVKNFNISNPTIFMHGAANAGKTRLGLTMPGRTLFVNVEDGLQSLRGSEIEKTDVESGAEFTSTMNEIRVLKGYDSIVIDSLSKIAEIDLRYELGKKTKTGDPVNKQAAYGMAMEKARIWSDQIGRLPQNVLCICRSLDLNDIFFPELTSKSLSRGLPYDFTFVHALLKDEHGTQAIQTEAYDKSPYFCRSRIKGLEVLEPPNMAQLIQKITETNT